MMTFFTGTDGGTLSFLVAASVHTLVGTVSKICRKNENIKILETDPGDNLPNY